MGISNTSQEGTIGKPVAPVYERTTVRINSEHTLYKHNDLDILKFGENINFHAGSKNGIAIGNMDSNSIYRLLNTYPVLIFMMLLVITQLLFLLIVVELILLE